MTTTRFHNLLLYTLIATLIYLPLAFGSNRPMYWWPSELMIQLISIGALFLLYFREKPLPPSYHAAKIPIALFLLFLTLQTTLQFLFDHSIDKHATNEQLIKTVCLIQIFCLTLLLVDSRSKLKLILTCLILSGAFQAVFGTLSSAIYNDVAKGTFINRNHLAGYLEMTLAIGIGLLIANLERDRALTWRQRLRIWTRTLLGEKARVRIYLALMVIGLILTQSRMGNIAFFTSMFLAGTLGLILFRRSSRAVMLLFSSLLIIDIFLMGTFFGIDKLQKRIEQVDLQNDTRPEVVLLSLETIKENPIIGTGPGTWYTSFPQQRDGAINAFFRHAHNDFIEFYSELGLLGSIPLLMILIHASFVAFRVQVSRRETLMRAMGFSATMAIISIGVHSLADFNLQIFANAVTFMFILALPYLAITIHRGVSHNPV